jgi:hypothetical protein
MDFNNLLANLLATMRTQSADQICADLWAIFEEMQETETESETAPDDMQLEFNSIFEDR